MKMTPQMLVVLTLVNLGVAVATLAQHARGALAEGPPPVLRGRGLEIVDAQGRVRASIGVLPAETSEQAETVLLRLITERGRPTVKIGASEPVSGLSFAGPTGTKDTYVILQANGTASALTLRSEDGKETVVKP